MVITKILGGLGNQMFQYAIGRALSIKHASPLRLDISGFSNYNLHQGFELERIFNLTAVIATEADVRDVLGWQSFDIVRRVVSRNTMAAFRRQEFVGEPHFNFWPGINNVSQNCYLTGYWQSEKYFLDYAAQIRSDFTFRPPMAANNAELANQITHADAVSLHVRRGDYVNNPKTTATHGLCSLEYYQEAIQYIAERVKQPVFYIFSDDIKWVQENLNVKFPYQFVEHNQGVGSYNDMRLMSLCKHHIIANSSFSWWGAWLNPSTDKIVVAPKRWFANETDTQDLIPQDWVRL